MIPANDPKVDYRALVRRGYDACAGAYDRDRRAAGGVEIEPLLNRLDEGDKVLDIGCRAGVPVARSLSERFRVTGVDVSREMVRRARRNVPDGTFMCADIMSVDFPLSSFDAVVAFYSVFHFGVTMYWSNWSLQEYQQILAGAGFVVLETSTTGHGYSEGAPQPSEHHPLVLAQKGYGGPGKAWLT